MEECHEVLDALDRADDEALREELGDLLFQVWFHAEIAAGPEEDVGSELAAILESVSAKWVRRHPHVFHEDGDTDAATVRRNWERLKLAEGRNSRMEGLAPMLPALLASQKLQERARSVGFDWDRATDVVPKVLEELREFLDEVPAEKAPKPGGRDEEEFGDLLFSLVNLGRHLGIVAEDALRGANRRFSERFRSMEASAPGDLADLDSDAMERLWERAKRSLRDQDRE